MVANPDTKINQLINNMHQYGENKINNSQSLENKNINNRRNSNNNTTNNKGGGGYRKRIYNRNTSGGDNKNNLQVK